MTTSPRSIRLDHQIALVTGGGGGIGAETAATLAAAGAHVIVVDKEPGLLETSLAAIADAGGRAEGELVDVTDDDEVAGLAGRVLERHGRLDVLVNNVGHYLRPRQFERSGADHWDALYKVNVHHVFSVTRAFVPSMIDHKAGSIINVSSVEGLRGYPADPVYGAFKAAVVQFTKSLGAQLGLFGIRVNGVAPDLTQSIQVDYSAMSEGYEEMWKVWAPVGRIGQPADQADVILFLASDLSRWVTGHTIPTDGGSLAQSGWNRSHKVPGRTWTNRPLDP